MAHDPVLVRINLQVITSVKFLFSFFFGLSSSYLSILFPFLLFSGI